MNDRFFAAFSVEAVAASTPYVLIDLSDTTNFKHGLTNAIILYGLNIHTEKATDGIFDVWVGVVKEVDATNGSVAFVHCFHLEATGNPTDSTDRFAQRIDFGPFGLDLGIVDGAPLRILSGAAQDDSTNWQTDVGLLSPAGAGGGSTGKPGAGDLVIWVEEVTNGGTLDMWIGADYETR